jgi:gluconokinase
MNKIVVMGVAGSGKSTLGLPLAQALGCPMVEGDEYHSAENREKMRRGVALTDADRGPWLARLGELMAAHEGDLVLSCSALKRAYRDALRSRVEGLLFVYVDIDEATATARVGTRTGHFFPGALVSAQFAALEPPVGEAGVCTVSALLSTEAQVEACLRWLHARLGAS